MIPIQNIRQMRFSCEKNSNDKIRYPRLLVISMSSFSDLLNDEDRDSIVAKYSEILKTKYTMYRGHHVFGWEHRTKEN